MLNMHGCSRAEKRWLVTCAPQFNSAGQLIQQFVEKESESSTAAFQSFHSFDFFPNPSFYFVDIDSRYRYDIDFHLILRGLFCKTQIKRQKIGVFSAIDAFFFKNRSNIHGDFLF